MKLLLLLAAWSGLASGQNPQSSIVRVKNELLWCCLTAEEVAKCEAFAAAAEQTHLEDEYNFGSYYRAVRCKRYGTKDECMRLIDNISDRGNPNIMTVDAGDVFVGGRCVGAIFEIVN